MMYIKFSIRVKAKVELKPSILIGVITKISSIGFTLGVKVEKENNLWPCPGPKAEKRYLSTWEGPNLV